jgi:peptidoglycan-N-acetylglucosamine deacetylase
VPLRVRFRVGALLGIGIAVVAMAVTLLWQQSALAALAVAALALAGALHALFVYYPKFDPSGASFWRGRKGGRRVALSFDDGPSRHTATILDTLSAAHVKATFFFLGSNATRHPELVERARAAGHAIGNHGMSHTKLHRSSALAIERELTLAEATLGALSTFAGRKLLRLPHGFKSWRTLAVARRLGYAVIAWSTGVWDSDNPGSAVIVARACRALRPGAILLLHDGDGARPDPERAETAAALADIIAYGQRAGYEFVTIPELLE